MQDIKITVSVSLSLNMGSSGKCITSPSRSFSTTVSSEFFIMRTHALDKGINLQLDLNLRWAHRSFCWFINHAAQLC